jgi:N6-L-threonylcarbamoyladenine synthase
VAANRRLRQRLAEATGEAGAELLIAPPALCTDNAVMGAIALERLNAGLVERLDLDVYPGLVRL